MRIKKMSLEDNQSIEEIFFTIKELHLTKHAIHKISIADIANKSGVHSGKIYSLFENKEDIFLKFIEKKVNDVFITFDEETDEEMPLGEKLKILVSLQLEFIGPELKMIKELLPQILNPFSNPAKVLARVKNKYLDFVSELFLKKVMDKNFLLKNVAVITMTNAFLAFNLSVLQYWELDKSESKKNTLNLIEKGIKNFMVVYALI